MTDFKGSMRVFVKGGTSFDEVQPRIREIGAPCVWDMWGNERSTKSITFGFAGEWSGSRRKELRNFFRKIARKIGRVRVIRFATDQDKFYHKKLEAVYAAKS